MSVRKVEMVNDERPNRVGLSTAYGIMFVPANTIMRCEALNNCTRFYFVNDRPLLVCRTLGYFEEQLTEADFIRIHRSEMINKNFILKYSRDGVLCLPTAQDLAFHVGVKEKFLMRLTVE
jgi:two-component system, LytTR family, response regulator